ncbi:hypothetical protein CQW23_01256 [Capsicum baccatum]|uniref:Uncharacterized protein n=1 Tax=Capsicum baccatum TaxID=33114 RepID=A0A2G2XN22_CAPBA|nr:hypothetical protein CQW23_01256 [Capsicum baccatum]
MDSGDGSVPKRRTRQQSLKYMVELIQRNRLSRSGNPTSSVNANSGRKRKMAKPSRGDERKNDGRRKSVTKRPLVEERSDDDSLEEESRPDVISIEEELADSKSSSKSESEASTDENNDKHNDKIYREDTLYVVSPKFAGDMEQKWASLSSSLEKNARALEELRDIISPLVHSCSENVKRVSLPGIRDTVVHVKPTYLQKELLKRLPENPGSFYEQNLASLISVHHSLVEKRKEFSEFES